MPAALASSRDLSRLSRSEVEATCRRLEQDALEAQVKRDALMKEIELLTSSATSFDFTSILRERVWTAETELKRTQQELQRLKEAYNDVHEDCVQLRQAKHISDTATRDVRDPRRRDVAAGRPAAALPLPARSGACSWRTRRNSH